MQSGYGVSEMQQFMIDSGCSPHFTISTAEIHHNPQPQKHLHHHHQQQQSTHHHHQYLHLNAHPHPHHHQHQTQQPPPPPPQSQQRFHHSHPVPITQQLFQQTHQFQLFQQEQQRRIIQHNHHLGGLDQDSGPENSNSPSRNLGGGPPFLGGVNFRLGVNESSCGGSREGLNDEEAILQDDDGSESHVRLWPREEESAIKEPFWRPLDIDNRRSKGKQQQQNCKRSKEASEEGTHSASNYKLFSELEAICKPGVGGGAGNNHQTGSGSALTGENTPVMAPALGPNCQPNADDEADHGSDTSTGKELSLSKKARKCSTTTTTSSRRKRKRKQQLSSIAMFFENLVNHLMDHQESLHRNFFEVLERRDQERMNREEAWRKQEALKVSQETMVRAQEQALASTREAAIISFLEKVTGETFNLPKKPHFQSQLSEETQKEEIDRPIMLPSDTFNDYTKNPDCSNSNQGAITNPSRWPKAEVQALIRVRSSFESRFQEPGLKGPLWEEVSSAMAFLGYHRSSKRCKEKWENINKYFRKTKDSAKKRPNTSKTCPYFHQLDQLYSKSHSKTLPAATSNALDRKENSELLEAIVVSTDPTSFKFQEMGSLIMDYDGKINPNSDNPTSGSPAAGGQGLVELHEREASNLEENQEDVDDDEDGGEEEGEGENQEHELNRCHN